MQNKLDPAVRDSRQGKGGQEEERGRERGREKIDNILIPADIKLTPKKTTIEGSSIVALEGKARLASSESWEGVLYRPVAQAEKTVDIRLIPYYAWGNRGKGEMTVWMPLAR